MIGDSARRGGQLPMSCRRGVVQENFGPPYQQRKPQFRSEFRRDQPPGPPPPQSRPNFVVQLLSGDKGFRRAEVQDVLAKLPCKPENFHVFERGFCAASLFFKQWTGALEAMVFLWEVRVGGMHILTPRLICNVIVPSDMDELNGRLKLLFIERLQGIMEGDLVKKWQKKLGVVLNEINQIKASLARRNPLALHFELSERQKSAFIERDLIVDRIREFKSGMKCILDFLEGKKSSDGCEEEGVKVLNLKGGFDWCRIHSLMTRECRRLDDGLPIYASRQRFLKQIHCQQIMVMIGETGSGKSTQLAQFLADSAIAGSGSIVCTQPRKLAAMSLAQRVREECNGCYQDASVNYCPVYSSIQQYDSGVIYMTDHCLLQHYMNDVKLSRISCVIVDEAHERSLSTDLLLALLKKLMEQRYDLRLIIMSATIDANQLAEYFFGCGTFHVLGRNFPVEIRYIPPVAEGTSGSGNVASYVSDVVRMVAEIHRTEKEGTILAFLTSQIEVEWACEKFQSPSAIALALHGKLNFEDQSRIFHSYPGKRKVIFTTNLAETSLTIPGVKYVVDSGLAKEYRFEPSTGMNVLKVCRISQSSANQRAGRAGRTDPGRCYRLYSENDFVFMPQHREPEIRRVHLGIAVLRILSLGIDNVQSFDFIDAPDAQAIDMAIRNLIQLGAVTENKDGYGLTKVGRDLVRVGIEPRVGKMVLTCFEHRLGREGLVLAAVMTNSSSIFCRVGSEEDKLKSDRLKVQFCHGGGDLFTLLSVYKEWESVPREKKNSWCWDNSINAKSMRRCQDMVQELETCLEHELNIIIPTYWAWNPLEHTVHDKTLKHIILSCLSENVAMHSGYDQFGYEVALSGKYIQLHPSCSLLAFSERPSWVVFREILSIHNQYMVCVTAVDIESIFKLGSPPLFDVSEIGNRKLQARTLTGCGSTLLKKFCGKSNSSLLNLVSSIKIACGNERIAVDVNVDQNEIWLYASSEDIEKVYSLVTEALEYERKWLRNECMEKCLYLGGHSISPSVALFGAGAEIKHLELNKRFLSVDIFYSNENSINDKELLIFLEKHIACSICSLHKFTGSGQESEDKEKWGRVTFLTPDAAKKAAELNGANFKNNLLKVVPVWSTYGGDHKMFSFPAVKARLYWPRRKSKGYGYVNCDSHDVARIVDDFSNLIIGGKDILCEASTRRTDSVMITRLNKELSETEIYEVLRTATNRRILDFFLVRGDPVEDPPCGACEEALLKEIAPFMPKRNSHGNSVHIQVFPPDLKDTYTKALITFDGSLHLEAAKALEQIDGKVLPICQSWQKIKCQRLFHSFVSCPSPVYSVIREQLDSLLSQLRQKKGVECILDRNESGSYRVKISANATKTVAELRRPLEQLLRGKRVDHPDLVPTVLQLLFSKDGIFLMKSIQRETGTYILFDRQSLSVRVFGSSDNIDVAQRKLVEALSTLHEIKQLEVHLRGGGLPPDLMKKVVKTFGPDLHGLKVKVPEADFTLNTRYHYISIHGSKQVKPKVEEMIYQIAHASTLKIDNEAACPICLCEVDDGYRIEGCGHEFCRLCLVEQCESAIKSQDNFPMRCAYKDCGALILIADLKFLLSNERLEELFRASLGSFVAESGGVYRFCPSPDCPSVYQVAGPGSAGTPFFCGACSVETCTKCHMEYHPYLSCERYREFKEDPDSSLKEWCKGKEHVKNCPICGFTIEKVDGCNHIECRCGRHICWVCLESFGSSDDCYGHLRSIHQAII